MCQSKCKRLSRLVMTGRRVAREWLNQPLFFVFGFSGCFAICLENEIVERGVFLPIGGFVNSVFH